MIDLLFNKYFGITVLGFGAFVGLLFGYANLRDYFSADQEVLPISWALFDPENPQQGSKRFFQLSGVTLLYPEALVLQDDEGQVTQVLIPVVPAPEASLPLKSLKPRFFFQTQRFNPTGAMPEKPEILETLRVQRSSLPPGDEFFEKHFWTGVLKAFPELKQLRIPVYTEAGDPKLLHGTLALLGALLGIVILGFMAIRAVKTWWAGVKDSPKP